MHRCIRIDFFVGKNYTHHDVVAVYIGVLHDECNKIVSERCLHEGMGS